MYSVTSKILEKVYFALNVTKHAFTVTYDAEGNTFHKELSIHTLLQLRRRLLGQSVVMSCDDLINN